MPLDVTILSTLLAVTPRDSFSIAQERRRRFLPRTEVRGLRAEEKMNIVILGCGRVGAALAQLLVGEGHQVKIIDQDSESFNRLGTDFPEGHTVLGNGTDEDVLRRAGISRADAFVAVTNGDNRNILAAQIARDIFRVPKVLCRIYDPIRQET